MMACALSLHGGQVSLYVFPRFAPHSRQAISMSGRSPGYSYIVCSLLTSSHVLQILKIFWLSATVTWPGWVPQEAHGLAFLPGPGCGSSCGPALAWYSARHLPHRPRVLPGPVWSGFSVSPQRWHGEVGRASLSSGPARRPGPGPGPGQAPGPALLPGGRLQLRCTPGCSSPASFAYFPANSWSRRMVWSVSSMLVGVDSRHLPLRLRSVQRVLVLPVRSSMTTKGRAAPVMHLLTYLG